MNPVIKRIFRKIIREAYESDFNKKINELDKRIEFLEYYNMCNEILKNDKLVKVHFINMMGKGNIGDYVCSPFQYFKEIFCNYKCYVHKLLNIDWSCVQEGDWIILGGGGLINYCDQWNEIIEKCYSITKRIIVWGAGINTHIVDNENIYRKIEFDKFALVGVRDYIKNYEFVPFPSCMLPQLSYQFKIVRKIGASCIIQSVESK